MLFEPNPVKTPRCGEKATLEEVALDFETYWADDYTLSRMTPVEYVLDPRFECLGVAVRRRDTPTIWVDGPDLPKFFSTVPWDRICAYSHNALFDFAVLKWRYNVLPAMIGDTLGMARAHLGNKLKSYSLRNVAEYYGMPPKGWGTVKSKGLGYAALRQQPGAWAGFVEYGKHDADLCQAIYERILADGFPRGQLELIDMQVRMAVQPRLVINRQLVAEYLAEVEARKAQLIAAAGLTDRSPLMSNLLFIEELKRAGLADHEIPMKPSPTDPARMIPAFAKKDLGMQALLEHEIEEVRALAEARIENKSTGEPTRAARFHTISMLDWRGIELDRSMPVPLNFAGAHTKRFSGTWDINLQNLKRGGKLRYAMEAPPGKVVVSVDASQIEARMVAAIARQDDLLKGFRLGEDVYSTFAGELYNRPINKKDDKVERFIGKTSVLSLGYGSGWATFQGMVRTQSPEDNKVILTDAQALEVVRFYRRRMGAITRCWKELTHVIWRMTQSGEPFRWPAVDPAVTIVGPQVFLPNGTVLRYPGLRRCEDGEFRYEGKLGPIKIWGAKLLENIIQSLAFIVIMEAAVRVKHMTRGLLMPVHQVHDELLYVVPERIAPDVINIVRDEISRPLAWMPNAPLAAAGNWGLSYGEAKEDD